MSSTLTVTNVPRLQDSNIGRPRADEVDHEMIEEDPDDEPPNPDETAIDDAGFYDDGDDTGGETEQREEDDGPDGHVSEFD